MIKTTIVRVVGADITVITTKCNGKFVLYPYRTSGTDGDGNVVTKVFDNSTILTAMWSHTALVHMLNGGKV